MTEEDFGRDWDDDDDDGGWLLTFLCGESSYVRVVDDVVVVVVPVDVDVELFSTPSALLVLLELVLVDGSREGDEVGGRCGDADDAT